MSLGNIYDAVKDNAGVKARFGDDVRVYPFAEAPERPEKPYAVFQLVGGSPENYLSGSPDLDYATVQVDVYADDSTTAIAGVEALRDALEIGAYITGWGPEGRDPETKDYRTSFTVEFITPR